MLNDTLWDACINEQLKYKVSSNKELEIKPLNVFIENAVLCENGTILNCCI